MNHSQNFVDPVTGVCTNAVEGFWSRIKRRFKVMSGTSEAMVPSYLDEYLFRDRFGLHQKKKDVFAIMIRTIAMWYPCP